MNTRGKSGDLLYQIRGRSGRFALPRTGINKVGIGRNKLDSLLYQVIGRNTADGLLY